MAFSFGRWGNSLYTGRTSYNIVGRRKIWFSISIVLLVASFILMFFPGLNPGIEFRGGSEFVVSGSTITSQDPATTAVQSVDPGQEPKVANVGSNSIRVQTSELTNDQVEDVSAALAAAYDVPKDQVTSTFIGPTWGADVSTKAIRGLVIFMLLAAVTMAIYFRAWRMAAAAIIALIHDLIITVGIYAAVGWEVTPATVIGFLTILGYSIYDTVVVFDKVRENTDGILDQTQYTYEEAANLAVNQTLVRSINTSVVALLPVAAILFIGAVVLGAGTLRDIALALFCGMAVGTASSIFIATPFEVLLRSREARIRQHTDKVLRLREERAARGEISGEVVTAGVGALRPGRHLGVAAQPKRRSRRS